jgi:cell division septal protein FtsQ
MDRDSIAVISQEASYERNSRQKNVGLIVTLSLAFFIIAFTFIWYYYEVTEVTVTGNEHYTEEEIKEMVMEGWYGRNSLFLMLKYRKKSIKNIPFIDSMDVEIQSPHSVTIHVYEKSLAGYIEYLEKYMYFDKDGMVVESSSSPTEGIPLVTGLKFNHVIMNEPLPVQNGNIFKMILNITQLLTKYHIMTDRIYFSSHLEVTLYFGQARVYLGEYESIEEKINKLQYLLPELEGRKGVLHMENYDSEDKNARIPFEIDKEGGEENAIEAVEEVEEEEESKQS